ncbi:anti-sigma factor family protein [Streptomyces olivochromogenes]|uniref:RNA polymerase subunit sigma n=1 Tax=Streptomyces olivochromogenes TaxID=1963 RepID=A0A250VMW4_STROL|nr:zf-HC2 domain-containing protein [Streptomyces olivochromogenes]KUN41447.1 RNA polymerase subunit sigma [Streptomyces olivochromogenes]GAX55505.1 RNA polymerase subunit sigma [Streptomyces olivochromogenes]
MQGPRGQQNPGDNIHETVGAYALGILDDAEATAFEAHLATCEWCGQQLDELAGMEPMLAALADLPASQGTPAIGESLAARPSPQLAERLVDEVSERRAVKRRRGLYLVAAAAALIIGGPLTVMAVNGGGTTTTASPDSAMATSPAKAAFDVMTDKKSATDPSTKVNAVVAIEKKDWGTHAVLQLKNVKGPLKCSLIAVGKNGERETVTSWSVPNWGYGIANAKTEEAKKPLYVHGGAAFNPSEIDHFEVMTFDGKRLVEVNV